MQRRHVRYRWDRIAGLGSTLALLCLLLVAWISPDETDEVELALEHPGGTVASGPIKVPASFPKQQSDISDAKQEPYKEVENEVLPCSCNKGVLRLPKNPYKGHQHAARNLPNSFFVKNDAELRAGKSRGNLVDVTDGRGYHIAPLSHSHALLLPEVKSLLEDMGQAFADELVGTKSDGTVFRVTSLTRTAKQQARLGRRNYNAINGGSTHSYGASFDIAYTDRPNNDADCSTPTRAIQKVLKTFQKSGRILVIPEKNCMHITLRP